MAETGADFTNTFRSLSGIPLPGHPQFDEKVLENMSQLYLPPEMDCGKVMFSVVSVCPQVGGVPCDHYLELFKLVHLGPPQPLPCSPPSLFITPPQARGHVETCTLGAPHIGTHHLEPAGKRAFSLRLKDLVVYRKVQERFLTIVFNFTQLWTFALIHRWGQLVTMCSPSAVLWKNFSKLVPPGWTQGIYHFG